MEIDAKAVLNFWFNDTTPSQWFTKDPAFDALLRQRFLELTNRATAGELDPWSETPQDALALLLLLDQFPRQLWRDTAKAFAGDPHRPWRSACRRWIGAGWKPSPTRRGVSSG